MKKIIVTGGSRGIGRACVELFSENDCAVAFIYRDNDDAADDCALETGAYAIKADISDPVEAEWAYKKAVEYLSNREIKDLRHSGLRDSAQPLPAPASRNCAEAKGRRG